MRNYKTFTCSRCGEVFDEEEVAEWKSSKESFSMNPFLCPDCFDQLQRMDLEDQLHYLMEEGNENEPIQERQGKDSFPERLQEYRKRLV